LAVLAYDRDCAGAAETVRVIEDNAPVLRGEEVIARLKLGQEVRVVRRVHNWLGVTVQTPEGMKAGWLSTRYVASPKDAGPPAGDPLAPGSAATPAKVLASTGLPARRHEEILPEGAFLHVRLNDPAALLNTLDGLIMTFVPEKAVPAQMQMFLQMPKPVLGLVGTRTMGQPLTTERLSSMLGVALDRPIALSLYPQVPKQRFVLSVPLSNPTALTGLLMGALRPRAFERVSLGRGAAFRIIPTRADVPSPLFVVCSDQAAYICGSRDLASALFPAPGKMRLHDEAMVKRALGKYSGSDLTVLISATFIKPFLPGFSSRYAVVHPRLIQRVRRIVEREFRANPRLLEALGLVTGTSDLGRVLDMTECVTTASYEVLFQEVMGQLLALEGFSFAIDVDDSWQRFAMSCYSQKIEPGALTQPLPVDAVRTAVAALPGDPNRIKASGRAPRPRAPRVKEKWLSLVTQRLDAKGVTWPLFDELAHYLRSGKPMVTLEHKADWVLKSRAPVPPPVSGAKPERVGAYLEQLWHQVIDAPRSVPFVTMPAMADADLEQHFREVMALKRAKGQARLRFQRALGVKKPFYDAERRFRAEPVADGGKRLVLEDAYQTRRGFFGQYTQHELINRRTMRVHTSGGYTHLYSEVPNAPTPSLKPKTSAPPRAVMGLLGQVSNGSTYLELVRSLHRVETPLRFLAEAERLLHCELDECLAQAKRLAAQGKLSALRPEALPFWVASLNQDRRTGELYCVLPGWLCYPREKVMPEAAALFEDYLARADEIGGGVMFTRVLQGEYEVQFVQDTRGLAFLVKSVGNSLFSRFMSSPEGRQRMQRLLRTPRDGRRSRYEARVRNPTWQFLMGR